ncbi:MAG TPA: SDR family NAD(P)-dependent oxidoreductase [Devosiaceae bacterium]|jgi:3-oxoacyl-[acyl-carrier protein] reductase/2-deoxy-D-gluconate 3-dehydrogenase|nr:SDR family NAD(P)-dependent oxidoreductase [Devosiaceae bacterium]
MRCDLDGRVAFVTGAAGAIGSAIARKFADNGGRVVIADINLEGARQLAATLPEALAVEVDIRDAAAVEAAVEATTGRYGRLDILVNNAGVNTFAHRVTLDQFPPEEWERVTSIDLDGLYLVSRAALQPMLAGGGGRIVNIASVVGMAAMRLQSAFVAAKAGIIHLTRSMALELGPRGVAVNAIAPGSIMTEGTRKLFYGVDGTFAGRTAEFMQHIPLGRPGTPEEIAEAALFLASPAAGYINGQLLAVDGGWTAGFSV